MFERTRTMISRLTRTTPENPAGIALTEMPDRRSRNRFPVSIDTTWRMMTEPRIAQPGKIRNISMVGMNLLAYRNVRNGAMLQIELPAGDGRMSMLTLACVIRVVPEGPGQWGLGCTFSQELDDETLKDFGGDRIAATPEDQRSWIRFPAAGTAFYRRATGDDIFGAARLTNISPNGVGLLMTDRIDPGELLTLELRRTETEEPLTILACAANLSLREDGLWRVGCTFIRELSDEELNVFL